ncbi:MAG: hypothetical protein CGW95_16780 [Phenylobacterium zucineum]|nr:MAG: hypothetical protein CGW95_16780 [Phenylobacterium zucineum]
MKTIFRAALISALLATVWVSQAAFAQAASCGDASSRATTLTLSAFGETRMAPDMARLDLGVTTEAPTAAAALNANAVQMTKVMTALTGAVIQAKDIQTSNLSLNAQYDYEANQAPKLRGYQASNTVTILVHDLSKLGQALDATVKAGVNQVNGVSFGIRDPSAAAYAARQKAVEALMAKAGLYAKASHYKVARLISLSEGSGYQTPVAPLPTLAMARMEKDVAGSISGGELTVRIEVSAVYELTQ